MNTQNQFIKEEAIKRMGGHQALAKYLGVTSQALSMWANGKPIPRIHQLELLLNRPDLFKVV